MKRREEELARRLDNGLTSFEHRAGSLPGIRSSVSRQVFIEQIVESDRRARFVQRIVEAELSDSRTDPRSDCFDPLRASIIFHRNNKDEDALWMLFLFVHFGKHRVAGWRYVSRIYGKLGAADNWDWRGVSENVAGFRKWLDENLDGIRAGEGPQGFGNHRKYESLSGTSTNGTGAVVESYVDWVGPTKLQASRFISAVSEPLHTAQNSFESLYRSMEFVHRFGRTARFDYLAMVGKIGLADIRPGRAYLVGSTGPLRGARLLIDGIADSETSPLVLDEQIVGLQEDMDVGFDVLEDALCNWQKSPTEFKPFRG